MKFSMVSTVFSGLIFAFVGIPAIANPDRNPIGIAIDFTQVIEAVQTDASGPQHRAFSLAIDVMSTWDEEFGPVVDAAPDIALPDGATGSIAKADFVGDDVSSRFFFESQEDDAFERFPAGDYKFNFSSDDGPCVVEVEFPLRDFGTIPNQGSMRPKIRNVNGWKEGKLCLPEDRLVIRWDQVGNSAYQAGDTEVLNQIKITDELTREVVVDRFIGDEFESGETMHPQLMFGDQEGLDLSALSSMVVGKTYDVEIDKSMRVIWLYGDYLIDGRVTSRVSFKLSVEPAATTPFNPKLHLSTNDGASTVSIRWTPRPEEEYLVLDDYYIVGGRFAFYTSFQKHFSEPLTPNGDHVFTDSITSRRHFYRVISFLK